MLAWLPPLFFFAVLMGSPVVGFIVFTLIGVVHAWQSWRQPLAAGAFQWTQQDTWLALTFASIPLFKALTMLWSSAPWLALQNAFWHAYYLFWPLILIGVKRCQDQRETTESGIGWGLICFGLYAVGIELSGDSLHSPGIRANVGILAQLVMATGAWCFAILTRPDQSRSTRVLHLMATIAAFVVLVFTTRRLELLGLLTLTGLISLYRLRERLNVLRTASLVVAFLIALAVLIYFRLEKFEQGFTELRQFIFEREKHPDIIYTSWGARLEMWRTAWAAFLDHPWLGISASARPFTMEAWGGPNDMAGFGHRHFHSHLVQTMVEGGVLGLGVMVAGLYGSIRLLIVQAWAQQRELALLGLCLLGAYAIEGLASATLQYDKANAYLVISTAWLWTHIRSNCKPVQSGPSGQAHP